MSLQFAAFAEEDFERSMSKARTSRFLSFLTGRKNELLSFEEVAGLVKPTSQTYTGVKTVSVEKIVGSEGRHKDFNRNFLPCREYLRARWQRIDEAHYEKKDLPSVQLYEIGDVYFVKDGNHRVSVARTRKCAFVDAEVIHMDTAVDLKPGMTMRDIKAAAETVSQ